MKRWLAMNLRWYWVVVVVVVFGAGCGREPEPAARPELAATIVVSRVTPTPAELVTAIPSATVTVTAIATAEPLAIPLPTATFTPEPTASPTPIVLPTLPAPAGLVYSTDSGLWVVNGDSEAQRLFDNPYAVLSPDGNRVLYREAEDLWLENLVTGEVRNLTQSPADWKCCPQWWPGRPDTILFGVRPEGSPPTEYGWGFLAALDLNGNGYQILEESAELDESIALSTDGQSIAYKVQGNMVRYEWGGERALINPFEIEWTPAQETYYLVSPAWSPDGTQIAWMALLRLDPKTFYWSVGIADLNSQVGRFLHLYQPRGTDVPPPAPSWSPDGNWIAIPDGQWQYGEGSARPLNVPIPLYVISTVETGEEYALYDDTISRLPQQWHVAWSPDGRWIAFTPGRNEEPAVWLAEVGTWQVYRVPLPGDEGVTVRDWLSVAP